MNCAQSVFFEFVNIITQGFFIAAILALVIIFAVDSARIVVENSLFCRASNVHFVGNDQKRLVVACVSKTKPVLLNKH